MWILIVESKASDANRSYAPVPGGAILPEPLPSNPLDRKWPVECLNKGTDRQIFNRNLAAWGPNTRPAKEAMVRGGSWVRGGIAPGNVEIGGAALLALSR